ncbi:MAG: hypothetical protein E6G66_01490 [Actinobacteria bacterium]|nr:MAG: hypothetical protein E6G66_01490 [Actinomycetota bacterium]
MASQAEETLTPQDEEVSEFATDYPKVEGRPGLTEKAAPIGSRPLSVSQTDLPHHPGADPEAKQQQPSEEIS